MIYTFAILLEPVPDLRPLGITGKPITYIQCDRLVAAVETEVDLDGLNQLPEPEMIAAIIHHDRLLCELFEHRPLLPLPFLKTFFSGVTTLENYLQTESAKLLASLQKIDGYAEFLITGTAIAPKTEIASSDLKGKDYLLAKRSQYLQQEQWRSQLQREVLDYRQAITNYLNPEYQATFEQAETKGSEDVRVYALLPRSQVESLQNSLRSWEAEHPHWQIAWSQPLPPYHFL